MLIYPSIFGMTTGPLHWSLLYRCRAVDNQAFVAVVSPARNVDSKYVAWGHSMIVDPWGKILGEATEKEMDLYIDLGINITIILNKQVYISVPRVLYQCSTAQKTLELLVHNC